LINETEKKEVDFLPCLHFQARHFFSLAIPAFPSLFLTDALFFASNKNEKYLETRARKESSSTIIKKQLHGQNKLLSSLKYYKLVYFYSENLWIKSAKRVDPGCIFNSPAVDRDILSSQTWQFWIAAYPDSFCNFLRFQQSSERLFCRFFFRHLFDCLFWNASGANKVRCN